MRSIVLALALVICFAGTSTAQVEVVDPPAVEMKLPAKTAFQVALVDAVKTARKKGEMSARQALKVRIAMLSPAFQKRAEDLAVTQMAFAGGDDPVPMTADGKVDRASIDWAGLSAFLEKLLPFILQLLDMFAATGLVMRGVA